MAAQRAPGSHYFAGDGVRNLRGLQSRRATEHEQQLRNPGECIGNRAVPEDDGYNRDEQAKYCR